MSEAAQVVGFIGLGIMGLPMATNLLRSGYKVIGFARDPKKHSTFLEQGGEWADSPKQLGEQVDILITIVTDGSEVKEILFAENGASLGLRRGSLIIDMSTINPMESMDIAKQLQKQGIRMLDAPVSGGDVGARAGTLSIMVGGEKADVEEAMPIFQVLGKNIVHAGGQSAGQVCKSCNQMMVAQVLNAVSETLYYAEKVGADSNKIRQALMGGFASSRVLEVHGLKMIQGDFSAGFQASLHLKDMRIVEEMCQHYGVVSEANRLAHQKIEALVNQGDGKLDNSGIHKITHQQNQVK